MNEFVRDVIDIYQNKIGLESIEIQVGEIDEGLEYIYTDSKKLEQILLNIFISSTNEILFGKIFFSVKKVNMSPWVKVKPFEKIEFILEGYA